MGHVESNLTLGDMNLYGKYSYPRNAGAAFGYYIGLAKGVGNAIAQRNVGMMYATGVGVPRNYARALVYTSFAAANGDTFAEQALGYWHANGVGTPKHCEDAAWYYGRVAEKAFNKWKSGPPGGLTMPIARIRLPDEEGGVYGHGASGSGDPSVRNPVQQTSASPEDILQYYKIEADAGKAMAQLLVGQLYYQGTPTIKQNYALAMKYFYAAAQQYPSPTGADLSASVVQAASTAAGYLGIMYWRGEGVEVDEKTARQWFERGAKGDNPMSLNNLGRMSLLGAGGLPKDKTKAAEYFKAAIQRDSADALYNLGELFLEQPFAADVKIQQEAITYLNKAANKDHIGAMYKIGDMHVKGNVVDGTCATGLVFLKRVSEKGDWEDPTLRDAEAAFNEGDMEGAFLRYLFAAERGVELAQTNGAWLIDKGLFDPKTSKLFAPDQDPYEPALVLWSRAANQGNVDARVKLGDYWYYGVGTGQRSLEGADEVKKESSSSTPAPEGQGTPLHLEDVLTWIKVRSRPPSSGAPDYAKAASHYQVAADMLYSAVAMWNLGWMHECGIGVSQDFHLAKRWYDLAATTNPEGYVPVKLSLARLAVKWIWGYYVEGTTASKPEWFVPDANAKKDAGADPLPPLPEHKPAQPQTDEKEAENLEDVPLDDERLREWYAKKRREGAMAGVGEDGDDLDAWEEEWDDEEFGDSPEMVVVVILCMVAALLVGWRQRLQVQGQQQRQAEVLRRAAEVQRQLAQVPVAPVVVGGQPQGQRLGPQGGPAVGTGGAGAGTGTAAREDVTAESSGSAPGTSERATTESANPPPAPVAQHDGAAGGNEGLRQRRVGGEGDDDEVVDVL
ncbi:ERAD-associated protein [Rhizophlyctis rosea]|nr:ERAD-associated protein [Rhizophlyctis rosea]